MPDLDERIRTFVDTAQPTVTVSEIQEHLMSKRAGGRASRMSSRRSWLLAGSISVAGVAALVAALLTIPHGGPGKSWQASTSASTILRHTAMVADSQQPLVPGPGQFLYVRLLEGSQGAQDFFPIMETGHALSRYYTEETQEQWTSSSGPNRQTSTVVGQPEFITETDRQLWEQADSPLIETGYSGGGTPPYYDVAELPTDPSKMAAYFAMQQNLVKAADDPLNTLWDFSTAANFLERGASGSQRAALLEYMATIPGVIDAGTGTTLGTKESGTIFSMPSTTAGYTFQVIIDQSTSDLLEQRLVVSDPSKLYQPSSAEVAGGHAIAPLQTGQAKLYEDFLFAGIADSSSAIPNGAPALLAPWPLGTSREPLPGSAY